MAVTGNEGETITLSEGATLTANHREANPNEIKGLLVGINKLNLVTSQEDVVGVRFYFGLDSKGNKQLVAVGVNAEGNDMTGGVILDKFNPCPSLCGTSNQLNNG